MALGAYRTLAVAAAAVMAAALLGPRSAIPSPKAGKTFSFDMLGARASDVPVDIELVLAVDISYSMDPDELSLQREGYVQAITSKEFLHALKGGMHGRVAVTYVEWAGVMEQRILLPWRLIDGEQTAEAVAAEIAKAPIRRAYRTSISGALRFTAPMFEDNGYAGIRRVIDVSGDGTNNSGRSVTEARDEAVAAGLTVNGLVILSEVPLPTNPLHTHPPGGLTAYYENNVIGGPGAFVVEAQNFEAFGQSLISKLIKEIALALPSRPRG
jgi:hypothetical protein